MTLIGPLPEPTGSTPEAVEKAVLDAEPYATVSETELLADMNLEGHTDAN